MILFDSSVVIDARDSEGLFHDWANHQIVAAVQEGGEGAAVNTIVVSEASVRAENREAVPALLEALGLTLIPLPVSAAIPAAKAFAVYLDRLKKDGKKTENRLPLPDFLIGAHAKAEGMKLVTRDPDRVRTYFPDVQLITP
ncbi:MAG TPA: type II toxin-antitoxin system VapC family toxin [Verrucomicrobiae bacterium]